MDSSLYSLSEVLSSMEQLMLLLNAHPFSMHRFTKSLVSIQRFAKQETIKEQFTSRFVCSIFKASSIYNLHLQVFVVS